jgi:hypothetical protein
MIVGDLSDAGNVLLWSLGIAALLVLEGYIVYVLGIIIDNVDDDLEARVWIACFLPLVVMGMQFGATIKQYGDIKEFLRTVHPAIPAVAGALSGFVVTGISTGLSSNRRVSDGLTSVYAALVLSFVATSVVYLFIQGAGSRMFYFAYGATVVGGLMLLIFGPPRD